MSRRRGSTRERVDRTCHASTALDAEIGRAGQVFCVSQATRDSQLLRTIDRIVHRNPTAAGRSAHPAPRNAHDVR
ncbi:MAG: hypothetical protein ABJE47_22500 [bacterium]